MNYSLLGKRIRTKRRQLHLTQVQLAENIGFSSTYVGHLERGNRAPSIETFMTLSRALHVTPDYLLQDYLDMDQSDNTFNEISKKDLESLEKVAKVLKDAGVFFDSEE